MNQRSNLVLPSAQQLAALQAQQHAAQVQANNQIAFTRAAMAASAAGSVLPSTCANIGERPADEISADIDHAVNIGFTIADRCLKRIGLNIEEAKPQEANT